MTNLVLKPTEFDVVIKQGTKRTKHYNDLILQHADEYAYNNSNKEKNLIAKEKIIKPIQEKGGRFLVHIEGEKYTELDLEATVAKVTQALRDENKKNAANDKPQQLNGNLQGGEKSNQDEFLQSLIHRIQNLELVQQQLDMLLREERQRREELEKSLGEERQQRRELEKRLEQRQRHLGQNQKQLQENQEQLQENHQQLHKNLLGLENNQEDFAKRLEGAS